ncbi:MAG TPA: NAD(P)/FAD-dependent oxidoreductase [Candidatus Bathyarchaeia archaeon]|nr:NAD(P)/FAD-dependent oxidoreductase [Candidatus Bathyarchaeia archaeon]
MDTYDVAVIGAGPAGVMAAWTAAKQGAHTVLLERDTSAGRKPCAEGILSEVLEDAEVSPQSEFAAHRITGAYLYPPDEKKRVRVGGDGYILDKPAFLTSLAARAGAAGAELAYGTRIDRVSREDGYVVAEGSRNTQPFSLRSKVIVGCDGTGSILARQFFPRRNYAVIAAFQYDMVDCQLEDESSLEIFIGHKKAPAGYLWIFPKGKGTANVGIGLKGSGAKLLLDKFLQDHPKVFGNAKIERSQAAPVPVGGEIEEYVTANMMLCGDAAGQVIPLTGAGIHTSLVAGKIAGEVAGKAAREGDVGSNRLSEYKERFDALWGAKISNSLRALESFERFSDDELNIITDFLEGQDLVDMAHGFSPTKAVGLMLRHPILAMKVAHQLMSS